MSWLRSIRPSPSPTSSLNNRAATQPRPPGRKRALTSIADSLTSFDFRRKTYSDGEADTIDLVSLDPISPMRVSRSHSPSELPQSEELVLDHITPPSSPPLSVHEAPPSPSPSRTKNATAIFEQKAAASLANELLAADSTALSTPPGNPSPTFMNAAREERERRKSTSIAPPSSATSDSEDSMASLVSMLDDHNAPADTTPAAQQCSTPVHHETNNLLNVRMLSPAWIHSRGSIRSTRRAIHSSEHKSDSDGPLRPVSPNIDKQGGPSDVQVIGKAALPSGVGRRGHSRRRTTSDRNLSETAPGSKNSLFHRPFSLSRRCQNRTLTDADDKSVARLPCFMTSNDEFMNTPAVQGLRMASPEAGMGAFIDGSYSVNPSFSAPEEAQLSSSKPPPLPAAQSSPIVSRAQSLEHLGTSSPRPVSSRSGLPLSCRSLSFPKVSRAASTASFFTHPPGMYISDMPPRGLVHINEIASRPSSKHLSSAFSSPGLPSPAHKDAIALTHDRRSCSPSSVDSSSRRHSMPRVPVKRDSAAHFPRSVSPSWDIRPQNISATSAETPRTPVAVESALRSPTPATMECDSTARLQSEDPNWDFRHQSVAGIIVDPPLSGSPADTTSTRVPITVDSAAHFPRSSTASPQALPPVVNPPVATLPTEPTFASRSSSADLEMPLYSMPIEPSFGRNRSNSKFEPHADLPPISEWQRKSEVSENAVEDVSENRAAPVMGGDGHKSTTGTFYDPPVPSFHVKRIPREEETKLSKKEEKKAKKEVKKEEKKAKKEAKKEAMKGGNKLKKKRPHEKTHKLVRYSRRFFLREKILNFLLGRQLGPAVADGLKAITCLPVGTDSLDLAVVAVPGGVTSPLHAGAVFPLAVVVGRHELESEERNGSLHFGNSRSCVALTAPDFSDSEEQPRKRRKSRHMSMEDLGEAIRHRDYAEERRRVSVE